MQRVVVQLGRSWERPVLLHATEDARRKVDVELTEGQARQLVEDIGAVLAAINEEVSIE